MILLVYTEIQIYLTTSQGHNIQMILTTYSLGLGKDLASAMVRGLHLCVNWIFDILSLNTDDLKQVST